MSRRFFIPEVIQSSAMDCGPAALKSLLEGFGIAVSYGRLREACHTDLDGTSIDALENLAVALGLAAEQIMVPADHLLHQRDVLPAIVVVNLPNKTTHFVVAWRRTGNLIQVMDPALGRRWVRCERFLEEIYVHSMPVPAAAWRTWAGSEPALAALRQRLSALGITDSTPLDAALADPTWRSLATLDAAARMVTSMVRAGELRRGAESARVLAHLCLKEELIAPEFRSASAGEKADEVVMRGAVLVHVSGCAAPERAAAPASPELFTALHEPGARPALELLRLLIADGLLAPAVVATLLLLSGAGVVLEALLFRAVFDLGRDLGLSGHVIAATAALAFFLAGLLLLELPLAQSVSWLGRRLEVRLRLAFLQKLPRLADRYLQSRLRSDMAERCHSIHKVRQLPDLGAQLLRRLFESAFTVAGIAWLYPGSTLFALMLAAVSVGLPLAAQPVILERDLRVRSHAGALSRFYLDAFLGLTAIRAHGAERVMRREHGSMLLEWARAGRDLQRANVWIEAGELLAGFGFAIWLLTDYLAQTDEIAGVLLLLYWTLNLTILGQDMARIFWQYPAHRNATLRLLEPLGALEETRREDAARSEPPLARVQDTACAGPSIRIEEVSVQAPGHTILDGINLELKSGSHVAVIGPSGAGKSSLAGLLLGWHRPAAGRVLVDNEPLDGCIEALRRETAWVDPAVQIWNRPCVDNLAYGAPSHAGLEISRAIEAADLRWALDKLPDGLHTPLGEGGQLLSGGEGQRVRLGRAMLRSNARLVILDEPFQGLDRDQRATLLARARSLWRNATLIYVTHDVSETRFFPRVLVIEGGRIAEDGAPAELLAWPASRYRALLEAEDAVRRELWSSGGWRRLRLEAGAIRSLEETEVRLQPHAREAHDLLDTVRSTALVRP